MFLLALIVVLFVVLLFCFCLFCCLFYVCVVFLFWGLFFGFAIFLVLLRRTKTAYKCPACRSPQEAPNRVPTNAKMKGENQYKRLGAVVGDGGGHYTPDLGITCTYTFVYIYIYTYIYMYIYKYPPTPLGVNKA